jgi:hypothetical protein
MKFLTHPNNVNVSNGGTMTSTVADETGALSYEWFKDPTRILHTPVNTNMVNMQHSGTPEDLFPYTITADSVYIENADINGGQNNLQSDSITNVLDGKLHLKYKCDWEPYDTGNSRWTYFGLFKNAEDAEFTLGVKQTEDFVSSGVAKGFEIILNDGSVAAVHHTRAGEITSYTVELEQSYNGLFVYYQVIADNGEEFAGTIDMVANLYPPLIGDYFIHAGSIWTNNITFSEIEVYEETTRTDTAVTTEEISLVEADIGTYYTEIQDNIVLLSSDIGRASEDGDPSFGLTFHGVPRFGTNNLDTTFTAEFIDP